MTRRKNPGYLSGELTKHWKVARNQQEIDPERLDKDLPSRDSLSKFLIDHRNNGQDVFEWRFDDVVVGPKVLLEILAGSDDRDST